MALSRFEMVRLVKSSDHIAIELIHCNQAVPARALYTNQATATWYQVKTGAADADASFTNFVTTTPKITPIPRPDDQNQIG